MAAPHSSGSKEIALRLPDGSNPAAFSSDDDDAPRFPRTRRRDSRKRDSVGSRDAAESSGSHGRKKEALRPSRPPASRSSSSRIGIPINSRGSNAMPLFPALGRITEGIQSPSMPLTKPRKENNKSKRRGPGPREDGHKTRPHGVTSPQRALPRARFLTSPSAHSLISSLTTGTSSSSGSNSTVTQGSYCLTQGSVTSHAESNTTSSSSSSSRKARRSRTRRPAPQPKPPARVDVFQYLDAGDKSTEDFPMNEVDGEWQSSSSSSSFSSSSSSDSEASNRPSAQPESRANKDRDAKPRMDNDKDPWLHMPGMRTSIHSDSGISMRSSSLSSMDRNQAAEVLPEMPTDPPQKAHNFHADRFPGRPPVPAPSPPPLHTRAAYVYSPSPPPSFTDSRASGMWSTEHGRIAMKLADSSCDDAEPLTPIYRGFNKLNHRVLLYMQQEISGLELHLHQLDKDISEMRNPEDGMYKATPVDVARTYLAQRAQLIKRISLSIKEYNETKASFRDAQKVAAPPDSEEVHRYRSWLEERAGVESSERAFLEEENDLQVLQRPRKDRGHATAVARESRRMDGIHGANLSVLAVSMFTMAALPSATGRLVFVALLTAAGFLGHARPAVGEVLVNPSNMAYEVIAVSTVGILLSLV